MQHTYQKAGYLHTDFKLFHLMDSNQKDFDFHYHDFYKVLIFLSGNVSYLIEGNTYALQPEDIILVPAGEVHKPVIHDNAPYERLIVYLSAHFFTPFQTMDYDLFSCFCKVKETQSHLIRVSAIPDSALHNAIYALRDSFHSNAYAASLEQHIVWMNLLLELNRQILSNQDSLTAPKSSNPVVQKAMLYIAEHLTDSLSIDDIAASLYLNRSYLMHLFKAETGSTIGKYITDKRLFLANSLLQNGVSITEACYKSGFPSYSAFYRSYKTKYHVLPKDALKRILP